MLSRWRSHASRAWTTTSQSCTAATSPTVYRYSLSVVRDPLEAEDVTQSTFLNAYRAYRGAPTRPKAWLLTIARNICFERYRRAQHRPRLVSLQEAVATPMPDASAVHADEILSALHGLPARQRTALLLDAIDGRSREEIAAALGIGETTVTGLLIRARGNLRLQLDEGMSCAVATRLRPRLEGSELPDSQRRAAIAHLRNCETCSAEPPRRSLFGLLGWLLPGLRSFAEPVTSLLPGGAAGLGATAAVVAGVGTLAWQTAPLSKPAGPTVAPVHATSRPTTTNVQGRSDRRDDARRAGDAVRRRFEAEPDRARGGSPRPSAARRRHRLDRFPPSRRPPPPSPSAVRRPWSPIRRPERVSPRGRDGPSDRPRRCCADGSGQRGAGVDESAQCDGARRYDGGGGGGDGAARPADRPGLDAGNAVDAGNGDAGSGHAQATGKATAPGQLTAATRKAIAPGQLTAATGKAAAPGQAKAAAAHTAHRDAVAGSPAAGDAAGETTDHGPPRPGASNGSSAATADEPGAPVQQTGNGNVNGNGASAQGGAGPAGTDEPVGQDNPGQGDGQGNQGNGNQGNGQGNAAQSEREPGQRQPGRQERLGSGPSRRRQPGPERRARQLRAAGQRLLGRPGHDLAGQSAVARNARARARSHIATASSPSSSSSWRWLSAWRASGR